MSSRRIHVRDGDLWFEQQDDDYSLLQAALRAGVGLPYECSSGGCGSCRFTPGSGRLDVLWNDAPGLSRRDRRKGFQLACQSRATTDLEIDVHLDPSYQPAIRPEQSTIELSTVRQLTRDIREFSFTGGRSARFLPGQYAVLENPGGTRRCYSMSNTPNEDGTWDFQIKLSPGGRFTEPLFGSSPGLSLILDGPYGLAHYRPDSPRDVLCIAGGSGISPMISIARAIADDAGDIKRRVHFFYGGRTAADICGEDELAALAGLRDPVSFTPVVSEPDDPLSAGWDGAVGFVHEAVSRQIGTDAQAMEIYFAGPPPMAEAVQRVLMIDLKVPFEQIHFDRFF